MTEKQKNLRPYLYVQIYPDRILINDYSNDVQTEKLIQILEKYGLKIINKHFSSPCG